jgi:beta-galactosidase
VVNESDAAKSVAVDAAVLGPDGQSVGSTQPKQIAVPAGKSVDVDQELTVPALLWDLTQANLHQAVIQVRDGGRILDDDVATFGIRTAEFKADTGFWLNGQNIKLKGVCLHDDADGLGNAVPLAAMEHRLAALKRLGCNAIRTSHNPVAPEFLDLCDRMGFLVMDEFFDCWTVAKNPYDYSRFFRDWSLIDARDTIQRDRNHPCIVIYSAGNEIHDTPHADVAIPILKSLVEVFHQSDPTRPVTQALVRPNGSHDFNDGLADLLDVVGVNYRDKELLAAHDAKPTRKIIGTENGKDRKPWILVRDNADYAGQFLWAGADYLGESRRWPAISHESGLLDLTDHLHPIALQRQSWWSDVPMVAIVRHLREVPTGNNAGEPQTRSVLSVDWTPANLRPHQERVVVYTNAQQVELSLNGRSLGSQNHNADDADLVWTVPFESGTIRAVARSGGKVVATEELRTAGKPAKIILSTDHPILAPVWDDVSFITATVVDSNGVCEPLAGDLIQFQIDGPGKLAAVENANVNSTEPFQAQQRHAYLGVCTAILRASAATGKIHLTATAPGLEAGSIEIDTSSNASPP